MKRGTSGINALIAVDKPCGMTSHDVVSRIRRSVGESRVGHAGTLDPNASGVLVVGIGQATRLMGYLTADRKGYQTSVSFGFETTTDDADGDVTRRADVRDELSDPIQAAAFMASLTGECDQVPPAYSAISVDGKRSYARARSGEDVVLPARRVTIYESRLDGISLDDGLVWNCSFVVSKGCYIRSIARDIGRALGTAAHVSALRRVSSGSVGIEDCLSLDEVASLGSGMIVSRALDPVAHLGFPVRTIDASERTDVLCGRRIACHDVAQSGDLACVVGEEGLYGIFECEGTTLVPKTNFPAPIKGVAQ